MLARLVTGKALVLAVALLIPCFVSAAKPAIDPSYAEGKTYYMIGTHVIVGAAQSQPEAYAHAEELYLIGYPQAALPLPSGYVPQCNPCFHAPPDFIFHDHVLPGAPGLGNDGTAGVWKAPWKNLFLDAGVRRAERLLNVRRDPAQKHVPRAILWNCWRAGGNGEPAR